MKINLKQKNKKKRKKQMKKQELRTVVAVYISRLLEKNDKKLNRLKKEKKITINLKV